MLTLKEIANVFAALDNVPSEDRDALYSRVRSLHIAGLIKPARGHYGAKGAGASAKFGTNEVCRARILCEAANLGIGLRFVAPFLDKTLPTYDRPKSFRVDGGHNSLGGIPDAIRGIRLGENWEFRLSVYANGQVNGGFVWSGAKRSKTAEDILESAGVERPRSVLAMSANELFGPFVMGAAR